MKTEREYRNMELRVAKPSDESSEESYKVEGYASTFDTYCLWTDPETGLDLNERIEPTAFDNTDFSDVVFRIDHEGAVYARSSAGTIQLDVDEHGLHNITDLGRTQNSRSLFEDIKAGNYPQMSFAFTVEADHWEEESNTRVIDRIAKVFDISPVSFPANPYTNLGVSARDYFNGAIEAAKAERLAEQRKKEIQNELMLRLKKSQEEM